MRSFFPTRLARSACAVAVLLSSGLVAICRETAKPSASTPAPARPAVAGADGPAMPGAPLPHRKGDAAKGQDVFRVETSGNEGFWTDAARMPQGMEQAKVTPLDALNAVERMRYLGAAPLQPSPETIAPPGFQLTTMFRTGNPLHVAHASARRPLPDFML